MSDRAMDRAMNKFRRDSAFRRQLWDQPDKADGVAQALQTDLAAARTQGGAAPNSDDYALTTDERKTINGQDWGSPTTEAERQKKEQDLISKIGQKGCTYT